MPGGNLRPRNYYLFVCMWDLKYFLFCFITVTSAKCKFDVCKIVIQNECQPRLVVSLHPIVIEQKYLDTQFIQELHKIHPACITVIKKKRKLV